MTTSPTGAIMRKPAAGAGFRLVPLFPRRRHRRRQGAAEDAGGKIMMGPMEVPGGDWIIQGTDPQGAFFALVGAKQG